MNNNRTGLRQTGRRTVSVRLAVLAAFAALTVGGGVFAAAPPQPTSFVLRPYLLATGCTDMAVIWTATAATNFTVRWGTGVAPDREQAVVPLVTGITYAVRIPATTNVAAPTQTVTQAAVTNREYRYLAQMTGLLPDTGYRYEVAGAGAVATGNFVTLAAPGREFTFVVCGDSQKPEVLGTLATQFPTWKPRLLVHSGDQVNDGNYPPNIKAEFFDPLDGVAGSVPIMPSRGNHDSGHWLRRFFPYGQGQLYYSYDCGDVHFVCLDTFAGGPAREPMLRWLEQDLSHSRARWKIVYYHIPSYDVGGHGSAAGRADVLPILRRHGVDLVFSGHTHCYERFRPMFTAGENEKHPITFFVVGGSGSTHPLTRDPYLAAGASRNHFLAVTANPARLVLRCLDIKGQPLDSFEIAKNAAGEIDPAYLATAVPESGFGALRALMRPSMKTVTLLDDPLKGSARVRLSLGPVDKPMSYTVGLDERSKPAGDMPPVAGTVAAGRVMPLELTLRLRDPAAHATLPVLRLECVFTIAGQTASILSQLAYRPPDAAEPGKGKPADNDD